MKRNGILLAIILLSGCATGYHEHGMGGGYSSTQYAPNIFNVSFSGNGFTGRGKAADFALLRSAEITIENGYRYFSVSNADNTVSNSSYTTPTTTNTYGTATVYGNTAYGSATSTSYGGQTYNISKPSSSNTIVCYKEKPKNGLAFDAIFLYKSLTKKYELDQDLTKHLIHNSSPFEGMPIKH